MERSGLTVTTSDPLFNLNDYDFLGNLNLNWSSGIDFDFSAVFNDPGFTDIFYQNFRQSIDGFFGPRKGMTIALIVLYSVAFLLGLFGNTFVICVVAYYRHMRTPINLFLVNLACGDLLVVFVCIPITLSNYIYRDYIFGPVICKLVPFLQGTSVSVSSLSLLVISTNRYFAIHKPMRAKMSFSKRKVYFMILSVWAVSCLVFIPLVVVNYVTVHALPGFQVRYCIENWKFLLQRQSYNLFIFIMLFVLPLIAMICTYSRIAVTLWRGQTGLIEVSTSVFQAKRILRQRRRSVRMLIVVASLFVICWFPYYVINIWLDFNINATNSLFISDNIFPLVQILGFCNSTVNPICYCFMSNGFRRALLKFCFRHKVVHTGTTSTILTVRFRSSDESPFNSTDRSSAALKHDKV